MSIYSILRSSAGRAFFKGRVRRPPTVPVLKACFEPMSDHPQRIGTAFDYALRAGLVARGFAPDLGVTVAEAALSRRTEVLDEAGMLADGERIVTNALAALASLKPGPLPDAAAQACWDLAGLDVVFRVRRTDQVGTPAGPDDLADLQALYFFVPWEQFRPARALALNPTFGRGSWLVQGADADVYVDGCIIDIKTTAKPAVELEHIRQVVCYAALGNRFGVGEGRGKVDRLGLYFSRAGSLVRFSPADVLVGTSLDDVTDFLLSASDDEEEPDW